jgi:two-component system NtrC family sensor kinase
VAPMTRPHFQSLYLKVVIPILALVLVPMAMVSFFAMRAMGASVRQVAEQRAAYELSYTRGIMEDVEHAMAADHGIRLHSTLERLGQNPDVDAIRILSVSGKVLHSSKLNEVGTMLPEHMPKVPEGGLERRFRPAPVRLLDIVHAAGPVFNGRRCARCHKDASHILGFVDVDISLSRQGAGMKFWTSLATGAGVLQFAVVFGGIVGVLGFLVVRPIRRLLQSMDEVQHGNLAVSAATTGTIEIDRLVIGFNEMVERLRRAREIEEESRRVHLDRVEQLATLGEMAAGLAHELRNPLSGIKAAVDVLAGEEKAEEPRRILRHVSEELVRVDGVVRQLLNYAKPKTPVLGRVGLHSLLNDVVALTRPGAMVKHVTIDLDLRPEPVDVLADPEMVQQVVVNLLINAMHAVEGVPDAWITISTDVGDRSAVCRIQDNGTGVSADRAESIFRPFITTKARGTGLGLATSRRLVELQGGQLGLDNPGASGACFSFTLPLFVDPVGPTS